MKTINILGDTQREQWLAVVNIMEQRGEGMTPADRHQYCDELRRYINNAEDVFDELRKEGKA